MRIVKLKLQKVAISNIAHLYLLADNELIRYLPKLKGGIMHKATVTPIRRDTRQAVRLNVNKLQAALLMTSSAAISIGAIYWLLRTLF